MYFYENFNNYTTSKFKYEIQTQTNVDVSFYVYDIEANTYTKIADFQKSLVKEILIENLTHVMIAIPKDSNNQLKFTFENQGDASFVFPDYGYGLIVVGIIIALATPYCCCCCVFMIFLMAKGYNPITE